MPFRRCITATGGAALVDARNALDIRRAGVNPGGSSNWALDVTTIFPNVVWLVGADSSVFHKIWPIDREHTRYENFSFYRKPNKASERFGREMSFGLFRDTIVEDILNNEFSQQALRSGAKKHFHLQSTDQGHPPTLWVDKARRRMLQERLQVQPALPVAPTVTNT